MDFLYNNFIADGFSIAIDWVHNALTNDWIIAILLVVLVLKLILLPLDIKQRKEGRRMTALQGKVAKINERYKNDPKKGQAKVAELYREEGVSPYASCLPMLFQMVFLIAFFGAIRRLANDQMFNSVIAAWNNGNPVPMQFEGFLWIKNIWQPDSFAFIEYTTNVVPDPAAFASMVQQLGKELPAGFDYIKAIQPTLHQFNFGGATDFFGQLGVIFSQSNGLFLFPLLSGGSAFLQQYFMTKTGQTPQQGKMMTYFMPLFSVLVCMSMAASFAIYWTFSNLFAIAVQFVLKRYLK